jgi:hypothetical protein
MTPEKMNLIMSEYDEKTTPVVNTDDDMPETEAVVEAELIEQE